MTNCANGQGNLINCETLYKKMGVIKPLKINNYLALTYCAIVKNYYTIFHGGLKVCASCEILYNKKECVNVKLTIKN